MTDVLRRGFDSAVANWPLLAIRLGESVLFAGIIIGSVFAAIVPVIVAAGVLHFAPEGDNPVAAASALIFQHWMLVIYVLLIVSVLLLVLIGVHSFVEAGTASVYVEAERLAGPGAVTARDRFHSFTGGRWFSGGLRSWWSVFWIYNIAWGIGGLIILVPLLATIALMLLVSDTGPRVAVGCGGLALSVLIMIPISVAIAIWTQKGIAVAVARGAGAGAALRIGWSEMRNDAGRHIAVALIAIGVSFGGAMLISMGSFPMSMARIQQPMAGIAFAPAQFALSFVQAIYTSAVGLWFLACYVGLTEERK